MMATAAIVIDANHVAYNRTESVESGWDNPFRPGGDLSREADEIVELIKVGKPITPTPGTTPLLLNDKSETVLDAAVNNVTDPVTHSSRKSLQNAAEKSANGNVHNDKKIGSGSVEVQRGTINPGEDAAQVEHITIKRKRKCQCCVIQ